MTSDLSVVVVAYHRPRQLERLLASLPQDAEQIVVVADDAADVVAVADAGGARTVVLDENPGYAAAVNAGVRVATRAVIAFMNDDLEALPGAFDMLCRAVVRTGGVVVPRIVDIDGEIEPTVGPLVSPRHLLIDWALLPDHRPSWLPAAWSAKWTQPESFVVVPAAMAALVVAPAALLRAVPLPEQYFLYWEEQDWYWRLRRRGVQLHMEPAAVVRHDGGRADVRSAKDALIARNAVRCVRATQGRWSAARAWPAVVLWWVRLSIVEVVRLACRRPRDTERLWARLSGLGAAVMSFGELLTVQAAER